MTDTPNTYINPKDIFLMFLRKRIRDPRARAEKTYSNVLTGDGSTKVFTLTPPTGTISCLESVTLDGTELKEWRDYYYFYPNSQLVFLDDYGAPSGEVVAEFKYGSTEWIYPDKPLKSLSASSFPRMNVKLISAPGLRLGNTEAKIRSTLRFQIDIWAKPVMDGQLFSVTTGWDGTTPIERKLGGQPLVEYLGYEICKAIVDHASDLHPIYHDSQILNAPVDLPYNEDYQCYHTAVDIGVSTTNLALING